jgi:undecaprenyl-diphosphatase
VDALALIVTVGLLLCRRFRAAGFVAAVRFVTALTSSEAKLVVHRHRPSLPHPIVHASGYSFPSGHAAAAASIYLPLAVLLLSSRRSAIRRGTVGLALVVCVLVSMSRVVLGVHFPSDVIAGFALGAAFTCAGVWLFVPIPASGEATSRPAAVTDINTIG